MMPVFPGQAMNPIVKYAGAAALVVSGILGWRWYQAKYAPAANFNPGWVETCSNVNFSGPPGGEPRRVGRVFVVRGAIGSPVELDSRYRPGFIDPAWYELSKPVRAVHPDEAETLVVTRRVKTADRQGVVYLRNSYRESWTVGIYDLKREILISEVPLPFSLDAESGPAELARWIENLPER